MLNAEDSFLNVLDKYYKDINDENLNNKKIVTKYYLAEWITGNSFLRLYMILVVVLVILNKLNVANALVILNYGDKGRNLMNNFTRLFDNIQSFNIASSRIIDLLEDKKYHKESFGTKHLNHVNGDFEFKNVNFKYDKVDVLKDLSFKVDANKTVAFVGKSGAGKTTIFNLLCKMYDNYEGKITIDGIDIKELDKESIRENITIVSQNPYIFNLSIRDNLKLVKSDLTDEEMVNACKMACLDDYIKTLPDGYDTIVGEGGVMLSGGQKQRLAIARAFIQKTEIILFDEATSALDNETQNNIQKAIDNLQKDYTILIIAHRLSTVLNADKIVVIDDGHVVAEGTHEYLLKNCKLYKDLYSTELTKKD